MSIFPFAIPAKFTLGTLATCLLVAVANPANAAVIRSAISATATSEFGSDFSINNTIDQSGLNVTFTSGVTDFDAYIAQNPLHSFSPTGEWSTLRNVNSAIVTYNLGQVFAIDRLALWNEDVGGIKTFNLLASLDGINFSTIASNISPSNTPFLSNYPAQVFSLGSFNAQYIQLDITECPQADFTFNGCTIGEVAFSTTAATTTPVPTPALLPGLIGMGVAALRKRGQAEREGAEA